MARDGRIATTRCRKVCDTRKIYYKVIGCKKQCLLCVYSGLTAPHNIYEVLGVDAYFSPRSWFLTGVSDAAE